ncbi:hypothetical protein Cgig2_007737 [Carnegiea gigantea]|uniref:MATH domain-containing protein n=1 Tax=Carnegiea gigantea TaxID=171969 RepID=A0A9Q1K902_9CARY|nr:hypothetical protein Cgig2_007737 [Carnegiea gigantea]
MAAIVSEESAVGRSLEELSTGQQCRSGDGVVEWRSLDQTDDNMPSTSPPYWDTDDCDDDGGWTELLYKVFFEFFSNSEMLTVTAPRCKEAAMVLFPCRDMINTSFLVVASFLIGPKPSDLYGKYTWKIEKFSQINKRELRRWSHFAQFTIAVVNKDPKKSKYSDGFVDEDTLIIKTQVQVIREKSDRPFRCLDCQYRRELVRVYLTNVEQICRRFVEERRGKLGKLIEDKARWSSFCAFWLGMDQNARRRMSREKMDMILKIVVKHFFIEKEVTSTLVMDSLYSGLKALEGQSKGNRGKGKVPEREETPAPIVQVEKDMFVLGDDILLLLERAAMEPLPPKDEKGPQNRTKDGANGEDFNKDSIERDERRLTELGRRTVEIFVLNSGSAAFIVKDVFTLALYSQKVLFYSNKIEVAYQEAVAFKRQEELIREEEAAWQAESEQKAKRSAEKDKKSKKKQGKQKRNNRKGKDKVKDEKPVVPVQVRQLPVDLAAEGKNLAESQTMLEKDDALADASDVSDSVECAVDVLQLDSEDRDSSPVNWDTDTSEIHPPAEACSSDVSSLSAVQNGGYRRASAVMDDSSSTCSTDSAPSVVTNGSYRSNSFANHKSRKSPIR